MKNCISDSKSLWNLTTPGLQLVLMCITGGRGKSQVSEAVICCASALKEVYLSINRKAQKAREPFRNVFVLQHDQERNFIVRTDFAGNDKLIDVNRELTF